MPSTMPLSISRELPASPATYPLPYTAINCDRILASFVPGSWVLDAIEEGETGPGVDGWAVAAGAVMDFAMVCVFARTLRFFFFGGPMRAASRNS